LVVVENDAVTTGRIGLSEAIRIQCSLLAAGDSGVTSRLEEVSAVLALHHSATVLTPVRKSCQNSSRPWIGWRRAGEH
jgi:hypothetical protein